MNRGRHKKDICSKIEKDIRNFATSYSYQDKDYIKYIKMHFFIKGNLHCGFGRPLESPMTDYDFESLFRTIKYTIQDANITEVQITIIERDTNLKMVNSITKFYKT